MLRPSCRRAALIVSLVLAVVASVAPSAGAGAGSGRSPGAFAGLGAWVDAFDYAPAFQPFGAAPSVTPDSVDDMAELGVETLYLQAAMNDERSPSMIIDERLVGEILVRAHRVGLKVVAWYYPIYSDPAVDLAHMTAMADFRSRGQRFDAVALDIESTAVADLEERNDRVVKLAADVRSVVGGQPLGAIVYPAVQIEVLNTTLWPRFPYKRLAKHVDVWMPMAYWTFRDGSYRDPYTYTAESITRLRENLGDKRALVHPVGGIGDLASATDLKAFSRAVYDTRSVGWSIYDYSTTFSSAWPWLRAGGSPPTTTTTLPNTSRSSATERR